MAIEGTKAYVGAGATLVVVDVTNLATPVQLGFVTLSDIVLDVVIVGGHAFVAAYASGVRVIDISVPSAPVEVGFHLTAGRAVDLAFAAGYLYVADRNGGWRSSMSAHRPRPSRSASPTPLEVPILSPWTVA